MVDAVSSILSGAGLHPMILEAIIGAFALMGVIIAKSAVNSIKQESSHTGQ